MIFNQDIVELINTTYKYRTYSMMERVMTEWRVIFHYLSLLALPLPSRLMLDYDFPVSHGLLAPPTTLISLLGLFAISSAAIGISRRNRLVSFGIIWFLGNLVIESSIIGLELVYEHRIYLPSFGVFLLVSAVFFDGQDRYFRSKAWTAAVLIVLLGIGTMTRNRLWGDDVAFWRDNARKAPNRARVYLSLGHALAKRGRHEEAIESYTRALNLPSEGVSVAEIMRNLGVSQYQLGLLDEAGATFRKALLFAPSDPDLLNNFSVTLMDKGQFEEALIYASAALAAAPSHGGAANTLGELYLAKQLYAQALEMFEYAIRLNPDKALRYYNAALAAWGANNPADACDYLGRFMAMAENPQEISEAINLSRQWGCRD